MVSAIAPCLFISLLAVPFAQAAAGCGGHEIGRRNLGKMGGGKMIKRQSGVDSTDPDQECAYYSYQPTIDAKSQFPTIWQTAQLVQGDHDAAQLFQTVDAAVKAKYPNITPKGTLAGDFSSFTPTYNRSDPDCWWTYRQCTTPAETDVSSDVTTVPEPQSFGLGFDDGPNCSHTVFYDALKGANQLATMFFIGSNVYDWPLQAIRAKTDGHEICLHTWSHQYMTAMTNEQVFAELYYTRKAINLVMGLTPKCWRAPFGDVDNRVRFIAQQMNLTSILWSDDSEDWRINTGTPPITQADIDGNYQDVINAQKNGTYATHGPIVLTHEINNFTMSEAVKWLPTLQSTFKNVVPVGVAYNWTTPYAETDIRMPDFNAYVAGSRTGDANASAAGPSATAAATGAAASASASMSESASGSASASGASSASGSASSAGASRSVANSAASASSSPKSGAIANGASWTGVLAVAAGVIAFL